MYRQRKAIVTLSAAVRAGLVGAFICLGRADAGVPLAIGSDPDELPTLAPLVEKIAQGVVYIEVRSRVEQPKYPILKIRSPDTSSHSNDTAAEGSVGKPIRGAERAAERKNSGSGVVFDVREGLIVTNNHVIQGADRITVTLSDGQKLQATRVGGDVDTDIALIKVADSRLTTIPLGDSDKLRVGDFVIGVGYPFQLGQTVTSGIVSALHRGGLGLEPYEDFIQTDASANPGDSGGALVNLRGELVGIIAALYNATGADIGIGFAIPVNEVRNIAEQILKYGEVRRGRLGVSAQDLTPDTIREHNLNADQTGALIAGLERSSAAEQAGLREGDVITAIGTAPVRNTLDLRKKTRKFIAGQAVELGVLRDGRAITVRATLAAPELQAEK